MSLREWSRVESFLAGVQEKIKYVHLISFSTFRVQGALARECVDGMVDLVGREGASHPCLSYSPSQPNKTGVVPHTIDYRLSRLYYT